MRIITKINTPKSIVLKRLVFNEEWIDKFDRILIYVVLGALATLSAFMILTADFSNPNNRIMSLTALPLTLLLSLYIIYRTATEKSLIEIVTPFDSLKNKQLLLAFAEKKNCQLAIIQKTV